MAKIIPAILTADPQEFQHQFNTYARFSARLQIDLTDGQFAESSTISINQLPKFPASPSIDLHLMVQSPSLYLSKVLELQPSLCIFHAETGEDLVPIFEELHRAKIKAGVAINPGTFPGNIKSFIEKADHALIFAGQLGQQGGQADLLQIEKVKLLRQIKSDLEIGWDGGANLENVRMLSVAGVNIINVGSAISRAADPAATYQALVLESEKKGVLI